MKLFTVASLIAYAAAAPFTANSNEYCPSGYHVAKAVNQVKHSSFISGHKQAGTHNTCVKCPAGTTSNGGSAPTCHKIKGGLKLWTTCSHTACKAVGGKIQAEVHCSKHSSVNPTKAVTGLSSCHKLGDALKPASRQITPVRISVFHHGHEQEGTQHKCSLTGTRADAKRTCECECRFKQTVAPTAFPTSYPTATPTANPTAFPTPYPTPAPTTYPTPYPTPKKVSVGAGKYCVRVNGKCFLWVSPCSGGCSKVPMPTAKPAWCPGGARYATSAEFSAALPSLNAKKSEFYGKCSASIFDPTHNHCDAGDSFVRITDNGYNELVLICDSA